MRWSPPRSVEHADVCVRAWDPAGHGVDRVAARWRSPSVVASRRQIVDDPNEARSPPPPGMRVESYDAPGENGDRRGSAVAAAILTYGTNLAVSVLSLVNVLVVSRVLGADARGEVAFLITVDHGGPARGPEPSGGKRQHRWSQPALRGRLASNSIVLATILGLVAAAVVGGLVALFPTVGGPVSETLLAVALLTIPVVIARAYLSFLLQSQYAFKVTNLAWLLGPDRSVGNVTLALLDAITVTRHSRRGSQARRSASC